MQPTLLHGIRRIDAVTVLSGYTFALMVVPSALVIGTFGAAGRPAMLLAAVMLGWYLLARQHPVVDIDRERQPVRTASIALGCAVLASYVSASRSAMSAQAVNAADRGLILLAGWLGVMLFAADGITDDGRLGLLLRRIVACATVMALLGIAEFVTGTDLTRYVTIPGLTQHLQVTDLIMRAGLARANSTAAQPLEFSAVLTMTLPVALHQARIAVGRWRRRWSWLQVALIGGTIPLAVSRSAILGLAVIALLLVPTWPVGQRRRAYLTLLAIPGALWLFAPGTAARFAGTFGQLGTDTSTTSRASAISLAGGLIGAHPWLGRGLGTLNPQQFFFVDDQFVTSMIETGIIGLLALVAVFGAGWYVTRSLRLTATDPAAKDLARCLMASLAAAVVFFATFDVLSFSIASGLFFLLIGCAGAAWRLAAARAAVALVRPAPALRPVS